MSYQINFDFEVKLQKVCINYQTAFNQDKVLIKQNYCYQYWNATDF